MTLEEYQTLTGITVPAGQEARYTAMISRTQSMLETLLGYTLDPAKVTENLYNELGKSNQNCFCPSVDLENLQSPDEVIGAYRLYRYNELDKYFHVDPFSAVHAVKLVFIKEGETDTDITIKTFTPQEIRVQIGRDGIGKYIEHCMDCLCECSCNDCVQLAVDADWLWPDTLPTDLQYLWADMVTYYADSKNGIKSESIDTHSYTKFDNAKPETLPDAIATLRRYAGPYGSVTVMPV